MQQTNTSLAVKQAFVPLSGNIFKELNFKTRVMIRIGNMLF
jgi:hypothetical protein